MKKPMTPPKRGGTPKGHQPQHNTDRAVVKNSTNKGMYMPSMGGAASGARGKGTKGMR